MVIPLHLKHLHEHCYGYNVPFFVFDLRFVLQGQPQTVLSASVRAVNYRHYIVKYCNLATVLKKFNILLSKESGSFMFFSEISQIWQWSLLLCVF